VHSAIAREKELKGWRRAKKIALIEGANPTWSDLSRDWYDVEPADYKRALDPLDRSRQPQILRHSAPQDDSAFEGGRGGQREDRYTLADL
jgi:hypothetical protein